jgi:hypothetical protein
MTMLERIKSFFKRPKAKAKVERPKPGVKATEEKAPEAGEKRLVKPS